MNEEIDDLRLKKLIREFAALETELEHVEFKTDNIKHETLAKNISAITNSILRRDYPQGYIIWGINDDKHEIVGTSFKPFSRKIGNEELTLWLSKHLNPTPQFNFREVWFNDKKVVVLTIYNTTPAITKYHDEAFIRVGANTRPLNEFPIIEREIWSRILARDFETDIATKRITEQEVVELLDFDTLYEVRARSAAVAKEEILQEAISSGLIQDNKDATFNITNLGALLYAKNLDMFPHLREKTIRIIKYSGPSKLSVVSEKRSVGGYIVEFDALYKYIMDQVIEGEEISEDDGLRRNKYLYPPLTIRELFANMIMHPDFTDNSLHPMVEIFSDRIEFVNPGTPIVPVTRFIDYPPCTRNQCIARELYKASISESRGSGWDKIAEESSLLGFSAPKPEALLNTTRVTITQQRSLADMSTEDRIWTIYIYTCWLWTQHIYLTNSHVRKIFNIPDENMSTASALIAQVVKTGLIKAFDEKSGPRNRKYWPIYAQEAV